MGLYNLLMGLSVLIIGKGPKLQNVSDKISSFRLFWQQYDMSQQSHPLHERDLARQWVRRKCSLGLSSSATVSLAGMRIPNSLVSIVGTINQAIDLWQSKSNMSKKKNICSLICFFFSFFNLNPLHIRIRWPGVILRGYPSLLSSADFGSRTELCTIPLPSRALFKEQLDKPKADLSLRFGVYRIPSRTLSQLWKNIGQSQFCIGNSDQWASF